MKAMDEDEKDGKDGVQVNPSEGRVPVSWNECADWLEAFGPEFVWNQRRRSTTILTSADLRKRGDFGISLDIYRLLPPSGLVAAPEGMDGGGWLGQGKDVPGGWEWRNWASAPWRIGGIPADHVVIQCRPPAPKREPEWVPLTKLIGRTIEGETEPVACNPFFHDGGWSWQAHVESHLRRFPDGTLDLEKGWVKVEPEEEQ